MRKLIIILVLLSSTAVGSSNFVYAEDSAVRAARDWRASQGVQILDDFTTFLTLPNVAADLPAIERNASYIADQLTRRGVQVELWQHDGFTPVVYGRLEVPGATRTIGLYLHYDGQPVDADQWTNPPWTPTLYSGSLEDDAQKIPFPKAGDAIDPEWRIYARSAGDDKAPFAAIIAALDALQHANITVTANLVFFFEGEEEAGSGHLDEYMREHKQQLSVDGWLILDGPVHQSRRPQLVFGVRGYTGLDITVYGATRYLHSGHYGNWAPNPAQQLANLLASMKDQDGNVLVSGYNDSVSPLGAAERRALARLPDTDAQLKRELGIRRTEGGSLNLATRLLLPSLNIRGMESARVGSKARNIIPVRAEASMDMRLVAGNDPAAMMDLVEAHIERQGFHVVRDEPDNATRTKYDKIAKVVRRQGYPAARTPLDSEFAAQVITATRRVAGKELVILPSAGGSLPLYLFNEILDAPVVMVPIANHDDNQHAPDENLRLANLWYGVDLFAALFTMQQ